MAAQASRVTDARYLNWIKDTLALIYLKEGLEVFVACQSAKFHKQLQDSLGKRSCNCRWQDMSRGENSWKINCPTGVCQKWLALIMKHHRHGPLPDLAPKNTDPKLWTKDAWEVAKLYQAKGRQGQHSARDTDVAGILALLGNCVYFDRFISKMNPVHYIQNIRNKTIHSSDYLVGTVDLTRDLQTMLSFLHGLKYLSADEQHSVQKAIDNIKELRAARLDLCLNRELESKALIAKLDFLETKVNTLEGLEDQLDTEVRTRKQQQDKVDQRQNSLLNQINDIRKNMATRQSTDSILTSLSNIQQQYNTLEEDLSKIKQTIKEQGTHIRENKEHIEEQGDHITDLYERQKNTDMERQSQGDQLEDHEGRLETLESKQNQAGNENREITDTDIAALQAFLRRYYKRVRLKIPNPVVSEELRLDSLYVDPDIKVLRETTDPGLGLVNVQDQPTPANVSQCSQLFNTESYKCRQIYITGDAGLGKSMFCNHLVDLWCKADNDNLTNTACSSENSSYVIVSEDSDNEEDIFGDSDSEDTIFEDIDSELLAPENEKRDSDSEDVISENIFDSEEDISKDSDIIWAALIRDLTGGYDVEKKKKKRFERKDNAKRRNEEDMRIMSKFKLLFYIALRESPDQYHIADMIDSQILQQNDERQCPAASALLKKVSCLVIIDGLDEWVCPKDATVPPFVKEGLPGRDLLNQSNVFLTTTRSWKFDVLQLTSSEVDKHVELVGLNNYSSNTLCHKIMKLLKRAERTQKTKGTFQTELREKGLSHLRKIPVILTQLICLWFDKQDLGKSQVQLYCSMLEMLLKRSDKNFPKQTVASSPDTACEKKLLSECFSNQMHCQTHQHVLLILGKVAFEALFSQNRKHALEFESSQMKSLGVDQNNVDLCLKSGILSQSKVLGKWSVSKSKMSFQLQEFLAAIYICEKTESVNVVQYCTTVESMLKMSQVWMFVSGIRPDLAKQLLTDLMNSVVLKDARLQQYRQSSYKCVAITRPIQKCIADCVSEASSNDHFDLCFPLEDFVLERDTVSASVESLFTFNKATLRSVYINTCGMKPATEETVARMVQLKDAHRLQLLALHAPLFGVHNMDPVCQQLDTNNNLTYLELVNIELTTASLAALCGALRHVASLFLRRVSLTFEQREQLLSSVSQAHDMRRIDMSWLNCTDHDDQCRAGIDLSGLSQVECIELVDFCVERLPAVTPCVKKVILVDCKIDRRRMQEFVNKLSRTLHSISVALCHIAFTGDTENTNRHCPIDLDGNMTNILQNEYNERDNSWTISFVVSPYTETTDDD